jgi:hypothetical protein
VAVAVRARRPVCLSIEIKKCDVDPQSMVDDDCPFRGNRTKFSRELLPGDVAFVVVSSRRRVRATKGSRPVYRPAIAINSRPCDNQVGAPNCQFLEDRTVTTHHKCAALFLLVAIAGCGSATIDATSMDTYQASTKAMTKDMSDAQKRQFFQDIQTALGPEAAQETAKRTLGKDKAAPNPIDAYKPLQGMTAEAIQAKAKEIREKTKKR